MIIIGIVVCYIVVIIILLQFNKTVMLIMSIYFKSAVILLSVRQFSRLKFTPVHILNSHTEIIACHYELTHTRQIKQNINYFTHPNKFCVITLKCVGPTVLLYGVRKLYGLKTHLSFRSWTAIVTCHQKTYSFMLAFIFPRLMRS